MIEISWKKINNKFLWNPYDVLLYFFIKRGIDIPGYLAFKKPSKKVLKEAHLPFPKGPCFIVNIDKILKEAKTGAELYTYLELACKRNVFDYNIRGITYLPMVLVPEYLKPWVEDNPLLEVKDEKLYFKYEQE